MQSYLLNLLNFAGSYLRIKFSLCFTFFTSVFPLNPLLGQYKGRSVCFFRQFIVRMLFFILNLNWLRQVFRLVFDFIQTICFYQVFAETPFGFWINMLSFFILLISVSNLCALVALLRPQKSGFQKCIAGPFFLTLLPISSLMCRYLFETMRFTFNIYLAYFGKILSIIKAP